MIRNFSFTFESTYLGVKNNIEWCPEIEVSCEAEITYKGIESYLEGVTVSLSLDGEPFPLSAISVEEQMKIQREAERLAAKQMHNWIGEGSD